MSVIPGCREWFQLWELTPAKLFNLVSYEEFLKATERRKGRRSLKADKVYEAYRLRYIECLMYWEVAERQGDITPSAAHRRVDVAKQILARAYDFKEEGQE